MAVTDRQKFWSRWITTGAVLSILGFLASFLFTKVVAIPETYPTKSEVNKKIESVEKHVSKSQDDLRDSINQNFDRLFNEMEQQRIEIRDINNHLRGRNERRTITP